MSTPGALPASRVLVVGSDADVSITLHLHLERAGFSLYCLPTPNDLETLLRTVAPHVIVLLLPAVPDASWGNALTTTQSAAKVGVRVVLIAPSREVVEPLAAVAGAEKALSRAEALSRPMAVVERAGSPQTTTMPAMPIPPTPPAPPVSILAPQPPVTLPVIAPPPLESEATALSPSRTRVPIDLMALIDEELVDEPKSRPALSRVEVNVSLVSEHNFYVGPTRRIDSGGVFISTMLPPPVGTQLQIRLGLADGRKIDLEGVVAFVREKSAITGRQPAGCGVRLINIPSWSIDAIDRFLLARQPIVFVPT